MADIYKPRLAGIDVQTARDALAYALEQAATPMGENGPPRQSDWSMSARDYESIGLFSYALGYPLQQVRSAFLGHVRAIRRVFELRGTEAPFPVLNLIVDSRRSPDDPESVRLVEPDNAPDARDFSLTNSRRGYEAMCTALAVGDFDSAKALATMVEDPPDASYLHRRSEVCTPTDQRLAYSLKALLKGDADSALGELEAVRELPDNRYIQSQVGMLRSIAVRDGRRFTENLLEFVEIWRSRGRRKLNRRDPQYFLCLRGLGPATLAAKSGVTSPDQPPAGEVLLPFELATASSP